MASSLMWISELDNSILPLIQEQDSRLCLALPRLATLGDLVKQIIQAIFPRQSKLQNQFLISQAAGTPIAILLNYILFTPTPSIHIFTDDLIFSTKLLKPKNVKNWIHYEQNIKVALQQVPRLVAHILNFSGLELETYEKSVPLLESNWISLQQELDIVTQVCALADRLPRPMVSTTLKSTLCPKPDRLSTRFPRR
jgi:hypothetical protein